MQISWLGHSCFRLDDDYATVITDPFDNTVGYQLPELSADIVTISHDHPHHSCLDQIRGEYRVLDGPGECEIKSVFITGIATYPSNRRSHPDAPERNVVFVFEFNGLSVCHLGDLARVFNQTQVEALGKVDILLVPVGGGSDSLNAAQAAEVVSLIEPHIVIPMHYRTETTRLELDTVDKFLKEMGSGRSEDVNTLKVSQSNLSEETQIIVLSPS